MIATMTRVVSRANSACTTKSSAINTTIPPTTTAATLSRLMTVPLSAWATSIIVTLRVEVIGGQQSQGRLRGNPEVAAGTWLGKDTDDAGTGDRHWRDRDQGRSGRPGHRQTARRPEEDRDPASRHPGGDD